MSNAGLSNDAAIQLAAQSDAAGRLAHDAGGFAATVAAFRAMDPNAFRWVLDRLGMQAQCELICEWVRIKICVLRCAELCGRPPATTGPAPPDLSAFAQAVVQLSSNNQLLRRIVDAVACGDADDYHAALAEAKLEPFCELICRWVCSFIYRRVCEVICSPDRLARSDAAAELAQAGTALSHVIANRQAFDAIAKAAVGLDCELARSAIEQAGFADQCEIICLLICVWRCFLVCRELCPRPLPVVTGTLAVEEARAFALSAHRLAEQPRALADLVTAVLNRNAESYAAIVNRLGLAAFCEQVCAWVCGAICSEFCICVCRNPALQPWWTNIGYFDIYSDISPATGETNKGLPFPGLAFHGGPNFAFYQCLELRGFCPSFSPAFAGVPMKYRFLFDKGKGAQPITGGLVCPAEAGTRLVNWPQNVAGIAGAALVPTFQSVWIESAPEPDPLPPAPGAAWFPPGAHVIAPDADGWIVVDPNAIGGGFQTLIGFDTTPPAAVPGGDPAPGVPAGTAVPPAAQRTGTDLSITFQATRTTTLPPGTVPDFSNALSKVHINNWNEVNLLNLVEFASGCCTPIDAKLSVEFTVDHEEMNAGAWSLGITSCSKSAPGDITPHVSGPGVIVTPRGGSGTIVEDTSSWQLCSYTVSLITRPGQTTGLSDRFAIDNTLTFCICGHK